MEAVLRDSLMDRDYDGAHADDAHASSQSSPSMEAAGGADASGQGNEGGHAAAAGQASLGMPAIPEGEGPLLSGSAGHQEPHITALSQMDAATWAELPPDVQAQLLRGMRLPGAVPDQALPPGPAQVPTVLGAWCRVTAWPCCSLCAA